MLLLLYTFRLLYFLFLEYSSIPDMTLFLVFIFSFIFFKQHRKTIFFNYLAIILFTFSYAIYDPFFIFLGFILLMKQPYIENYRNKIYISTAHEIRKSSVFKAIVIIFFVLSIKNYIYYGTNILNGITRPIKLSIDKRRLEKETGELVWAVPYFHDFLESRLTFRTKDYFPVKDYKDFYWKKLETQAVEYEKEKLDRSFPYETLYVVNLYPESFKDWDHKNSPRYNEAISRDDPNLKIKITIYVLGDLFKSENERMKVEKSVKELYNYYISKNFNYVRITISSYPKSSSYVKFLEKYYIKKRPRIIFDFKDFKFKDIYKKDGELRYNYLDYLSISTKESEKQADKLITDVTELKNRWNIKTLTNCQQ